MSAEPFTSIQEKIEDIQEKADVISGLFTDLSRYLSHKPGQKLTLTPCYLQAGWWLLPTT